MSFWDMITGNLGSLANAVSGGTWNPFGQSTQQQQLQFAQQQASGAFLPQYAANMRAAGFNPYGGGMSPPSVSLPGAEGFSGSPLGSALGGTLSRALSSGSQPETKMDQLQQRLVESQITHSELLNSQLAASLAGRDKGAADRPFFGGTGGGIPLPPSAPAELLQLRRDLFAKEHPAMWTEYFDNPTSGDKRFMVAPSAEFQRGLFSGVPAAPLYPAIASALAGKNIEPFARSWLSTLGLGGGD